MEDDDGMPPKAWFKVWYVGNGGMLSKARYVKLYHFKGRGSQEHMGHEVEAYFGDLPSSVRRVCWQLAKTLPDEFIDEEIKIQRDIIQNAPRDAIQEIKNLKAMRKKNGH